MKQRNHFQFTIFRFVFLLFLGIGLKSAAAESGAEDKVLGAGYEKAAQASAELIQARMDERHIPGVTVAVMVKGEIVWAQGIGIANLEYNLPVTPATKMRIGSVSKSVSSAAVGLLYEQGKLDMEAPVQNYVPDFPEKKWPINTRQLAGHTAGIRHYRGMEFASSKHYATVDAGLVMFKDDPLLFEPDTQYSYSSYGWNLLSAVVEGASGEEFLGYMDKNVFKPLGMNETVAEYMDKIIANRTGYYVYSDGEFKNAPYVDNSYKWAGGGFVGTASDLLRFADGILYGDFLKPETVKYLVKGHTLRSGKATNYGIGWRNDISDAGHFVGHTGGSMGGSSAMVILQKERIIAAVVCNTGAGGWWGIGKEIIQRFKNKS